jgi:hypothetical protein
MLSEQSCARNFITIRASRRSEILLHPSCSGPTGWVFFLILAKTCGAPQPRGAISLKDFVQLLGLKAIAFGLQGD